MKRSTLIATMVTGLAIFLAVGTLQERLHAQSGAAQTANPDVTSPSCTATNPDCLRSVIGLRIAPVTLNFGNRDHLLVGLGSYLVNAAACNDCHTTPSYAPGHDPFLGEPQQINAAVYLAGGHAYTGDDGETVYPPDITPDSTGKPAGLNYSQFRLAMFYGQDPGANRILQVMPWPEYGEELTERDLLAIYEYLSSIPPLKCNGPGC
jgi:hypothetical protein